MTQHDLNVSQLTREYHENNESFVSIILRRTFEHFVRNPSQHLVAEEWFLILGFYSLEDH